MLDELRVNLGKRSYPIYMATDFDGLSQYIQNIDICGKIILITDSNVDLHYSEKCLEVLKKSGLDIYKYIFQAGEANKNLDTVRDIYKFLHKIKPERKSAVVALGGGVVGDVAGFIAATFLRGINFIQIPTSLIAQADSSVGGKVGVDFEGSKNMVGAFYQPRFVYINVNTLKTLPERELKAGMAEVIKHSIIRDADFFSYIEENIDSIYSLNEEILKILAVKNCSIKAKVVEIDETEEGLRAILNFGHTIGHSIETVMNFKLLHGECVSLGMVGAFRLAEELSLVKKEDVKRVEELLQKAGLPTSIGEIDIDKIYKQMFHDKKIQKSKLNFVLPTKIGKVVAYKIDNEKLLKKVLKDLVNF